MTKKLVKGFRATITLTPEDERILEEYADELGIASSLSAVKTAKGYAKIMIEHPEEFKPLFDALNKLGGPDDPDGGP